jgi:hypothetical protein
MFIYPATFNIFTNREDFVATIGIFDDDTGAPFNIAGIILPSMASFTGSNWNVSASGIATTSSSTLTIPFYPIGNALTAISLVVPSGLGILPASPVTISDAGVSGSSMIGYVISYASSTGILICQIGNTFQFEIRRPHPNEPGVGYVTWYDFGIQTDVGPLISAALGTGILIVDLGVIQITILESQMKQINGNGTYRAAMTMTDSQNTRQIFLASLPIIQGGVTN